MVERGHGWRECMLWHAAATAILISTSALVLTVLRHFFGMPQDTRKVVSERSKPRSFLLCRYQGGTVRAFLPRLELIRKVLGECPRLLENPRDVRTPLPQGAHSPQSEHHVRWRLVGISRERPNSGCGRRER